MCLVILNATGWRHSKAFMCHFPKRVVTHFRRHTAVREYGIRGILLEMKIVHAQTTFVIRNTELKVCFTKLDTLM